MMKEEFILRSGSDGLDISCLMIRPEGKPKAILQIAHGMCGYKERYMGFMEYMSSHGVVCVANDHRGHGKSIRSKDDLGYMYSGGYEALTGDMRMVHEFISGLYPDVPVYLLGHSMGSLASLLYSRKWADSLSGLILCGIPYYELSFIHSYSFFRFLSNAGCGHIRFPLLQNLGSARFNYRFADEGTMAWTCSDPAVRQAFLDNPSGNFNFTLNGYMNLIGMLKEVYSSDSWINTELPGHVLLLSGADDPCTAYGKSMDVISLLVNNYCLKDIDVRRHTYPKMRHEILNEIYKVQVWDDILSFLFNLN
jgi:alpha-beta hydrolase superfamily lysophospholipase